MRPAKSSGPVPALSRRLVLLVALTVLSGAAIAAASVRAPASRAVTAQTEARPPAAADVRTPSPSPQPIVAHPADINLVHLDAIVVDRAGRPVRHLDARDFELRVDGTPVPIERVAFRPGPPVPPSAASAAVSGRMFGLLLDDYHVPAGRDTARVREALAQFAAGLTPADRVLVMKPLDRLTAAEPAVSSAAVARMVRGFDGRADDFTPRTPFERSFIPRAPAAAAAARAQLVLSALEALTTRLGRIGVGRKALLFVSEGFAGTGARRKVPLPDVQAVLRAADRFDVAIYAVDPADGPRPGAARALLRTLTTRTGGAIIDGTDLGSGLARAARELDGYYMLTFRSPHVDGRFHRVAVRVDRAGVRVQTRPEYWLPSAADVRLAELVRHAGLAPLPRLPPFVPTHISGLIQPWFGLARGPNGRTQVTMTWEPDQPGLEGRLPVAAGEIEVHASTPGGRALFHGTLAPVLSEASVPGLARRAVFDVPPGLVRLDIQIRAANGWPLGTDVRALDVPSLKTTRTELSTPEIFRSSTARGFAALVHNPDAAPVVSRDFLSTERLLIRVHAYGPGRTPPTVTARLLNLTGQPMRTLDRLPGPHPNGAVQFDLLLAVFPPGQYTIELTAAGRGGEATTLVTFRIVG